jgi:hypothetical protein
MITLATDGSVTVFYLNGVKVGEVEPYTAELVLRAVGFNPEPLHLDDFPDEL